MDRIEQLAFDLDFNIHKMSYETAKEKLAELIYELEQIANYKTVSRFKYIYNIMTNDNYKYILDKEL